MNKEQKLSNKEAGFTEATKPGSGDKQWSYTDNWIYLIRMISIAKLEGEMLRYERGIEALIALLYDKEKKQVFAMMDKTDKDIPAEEVFEFIIEMLEKEGYLGSKTTILRGSG